MSSGRKTFYAAVIVLTLLIALSLALATAARYYLPAYLAEVLVKKISASTGSPVHVQVRRSWLYGADFGNIRIGSAENPTLIIPSVQVDYSPWELYRKKRINHVHVVGAEVFTELSGGRLRLANTKRVHVIGRRQDLQSQESHMKAHLLPFSIGRLTIEGAVQVSGNGLEAERVPIKLSVAEFGKNLSKTRLSATVYPRGQKIAATARPADDGNQVLVDIRAKDLVLAAFSDLLKTPAVQQIEGRVASEARLKVGLFPFKLGSVAARCSVSGAKLKTGALLVQTNMGDAPFSLNLEMPEGGLWKITGSSLSVDEPFSAALDGFSMKLGSSAKGIAASGDIQLAVDPAQWQQEAAGKKTLPARLALKVSASYLNDGNWRVQLATGLGEKPGKNQVAVNRGGVHLQFQQPQIDCSGQGRGTAGNLDINVEIPVLKISSGGLKGAVNALHFRGRGNFSRETRLVVKGKGDLVLPGFRLTSGLASATLEKTQLSGEFQFSPSDGLAADGWLNVSGGELRLPGHKLRLSAISGRAPFLWPARQNKQGGRFQVGSIAVDKKGIGGVKGTIGQTKSGLSFRGTHASRLIPQLAISFGGKFDIYRVRNPTLSVRLDLKRPHHAPEADLSGLIPGAQGLFIGGDLSMHSDFLMDGKRLSGQVTAAWKNGRLRMPERKIFIEGIQASLRLPKLPQLGSASRQMFGFSRAAVGDLEVESGDIEFRVESARALFIEKSRFSWCQGFIEIPSFRIDPDTYDYLLTLYCDRLNLAELLGQFGIAAEGKGTLNGKLPLRYREGLVYFDDGFLFSTPGEGGKIRIADSELLTAGVPADSPEYLQMALASEALKDYDYSWAKLNLNTQEDDLLLRLQLDGRPGRPLPFVYRKETGTFVKVDADIKGSRFQGIRLDVNFRLPLNQLLAYDGILRMEK